MRLCALSSLHLLLYIFSLISSLLYLLSSLQVIEFEELSGVIFPQTVVNEIQQSSLKHYRLFQSSLYLPDILPICPFRRICNYIRERKNRSVFFPNEFFKSTYLERNSRETISEWQNRMIYQVLSSGPGSTV